MLRNAVIATERKTQAIDLTAQRLSLVGAIQNGIAVFSLARSTAAIAERQRVN